MLQAPRDLVHLLQSISCIMANYKHGLTGEEAIYEALKLQFRGAEKQKPSTLDLAISFMGALQAKAQTRRVAKRELLEETIMEYNNKMPSKSWKLIGDSKTAVRNLTKVPENLRNIMREHLNAYRHESSAITVAVLACGVFVPGTVRLQPDAKGEWLNIMTVSEASSVEWGNRLIKGFESRAPACASTKQKDRTLICGGTLCCCLQVIRITHDVASDPPPPRNWPSCPWSRSQL